MTKKIKIATITLASLLMVLASYFMFFKGSKKVENLNSLGEVSFNIPDSIRAGEHFKTDLDFNAENCHLLMSTSWGNYILEPVLENSKWHFDMKDSLTQTAGLYILDLACDGELKNTKKMKVLSGVAAEPLEAFIGSKSIPADNGGHWAMILGIPADTFNNLTPDKTPVNFSLHRPDESVERQNKLTEHGVAYHKIYSKSKVGKTIIGITSGAATAKEKELAEMPGFPVNFKIYSEKVYSYADKRQNFHLKTSIIKDKFGNIIADGSLLNIDVTDSDNSMRVLTAYTMDGIAELDIQNPSLAGQIEINASIYGDAQSNTLRMAFKKYLKDLSAVFVPDAKVVKVGPLIGPLKQYMSDGAEIEMYLEPTDELLIGVVKNGYAKIDLSNLKPGSYQGLVKSGGLEVKVDFKLEANE